MRFGRRPHVVSDAMARIFYSLPIMPTRHARPNRAVLALGLLAALLQAGVSAPVEAICPAPVAAVPSGCCPETAPPRCPSCPSESRPSCPAPQPARTRSCCSPAALPPGETVPEPREARAGDSTRSAPETTAAVPEQSANRARRAAVTAASPPPRLLSCTFRN